MLQMEELFWGEREWLLFEQRIQIVFYKCVHEWQLHIYTVPFRFLWWFKYLNKKKSDKCFYHLTRLCIFREGEKNRRGDNLVSHNTEREVIESACKPEFS